LLLVCTCQSVPFRRASPQAQVRTDPVCWLNFGGNSRRTLARPTTIGIPAKPQLWVVGMKDYMEFPPSYCDGHLYVNTYKGKTVALDAHTGRILWKRQAGGPTPSTPAIAGPRLIVSSIDGTVSALTRANGRLLWQLRTRAKFESSPVVVTASSTSAQTTAERRAPSPGSPTSAAASSGQRWSPGRSSSSRRSTRRRSPLRTNNGKVVWKIGMGKYSPGIVGSPSSRAHP